MPASNGLQKVTGIMLIIMGAFIYAFALNAGIPLYTEVLVAVIAVAWELRGESLYGQIIVGVLLFFLSLVSLFYVAMSMMAFFFTVLGAGMAFTAGVICFSRYSDKKVELVLGGISILALPTAVASMTEINRMHTLDALDSLVVFIPYLSFMDILIIISVIIPILFLVGTIAKKEANK